MNPCVHEDELLDSLGRGYVNAELTAHVDACPSCRELRLVAGALLDDRVEAMTEAAVPSSTAMWYRMQMRQRHDVAARARRSLLIGQALTLAVAVILIGAYFGTNVAVGAREIISSIRVSTPLLLIVATWVLAAPIAGWVAIRQK